MFVQKQCWNEKLKMEGKPQNVCRRSVQMKKDVWSKPYPNCPLMWDLNHRKLYHNRANPQNSGSAGDNLIKKPNGKERDVWDFAPYMDILPDESTKWK